MIKELHRITLRLIILAILCISLYACNPATPPDTPDNPDSPALPTLTISEDGVIPEQECIERGLKGKFIMIESKYCGHCQATLPLFQDACSDISIEPVILDISEKEQRKQMEAFGVDVRFTPTFIFDCKYYVGGKSKEECIDLLSQCIGQ